MDPLSVASAHRFEKIAEDGQQIDDDDGVQKLHINGSILISDINIADPLREEKHEIACDHDEELVDIFEPVVPPSFEWVVSVAQADDKNAAIEIDQETREDVFVDCHCE